ncbi:MAG: undecaprenyldiphospho-muramoylpentapeptide beta-N-acetylglucosaminyltransferase [Candidatus Nanopelagicales bacterium]
MRVLLAGGGTAGHVEPALNLADVLTARDLATEVAMLGTERGLEMRLVPERGYDLELITAVPMPRRINGDLIALPNRLRTSVREVRAIMAKRRSDVVVGFGGYVAMPAYLAARSRLPMVIHEANAKAGLANRVGARFTPYVAEATAGALPHAITLGIPLRPAIVTLDRSARRQEGRLAFDLDPVRPCLFVFGGSQGARRINEAVVGAVPELVANGFQVLHAIGTNNADQVIDIPAHHLPYYRAVPYVDRMDLAYAAADLALCRAGAMTCAELAAVGLPAIYVPLPIGNGEQRLNAAPTVAAGGGEFLADADLDADRIATRATALLAEPTVRERMSRAAAGQGVRDAGARLADMVELAIG